MDIEIKMTKEVKDKLNELGVYEKWLENTKVSFDYCRNRYKKTNNKTHLRFMYGFHTNIQNNITTNDIRSLIRDSFNWDSTKEGFYYWKDICNEIFKK